MITLKLQHLRDIKAVRVTSRNPNVLGVERQFVRGYDRLMLVSTHVPEEEQRQAGALLALLFRYRPDISVIDIAYTDAGYWFASALEEKDSTVQRYRGEGMSLTEAVVALIAYVQGL